MAIDMTTVKQITHNNKEVVKIEDGLGKVLWQKEIGPEWHTIFEGSWSETWDSNKSRAYVHICDLVVTDKPTKLRITGSINNTIYNPIIELTWINESKETFQFPSLPFAINKETTQFNVTDSSWINILQCNCTRWQYENAVYGGFKFQLINNRNLRAELDGYHLQEYSITLNITKVEQYY